MDLNNISDSEVLYRMVKKSDPDSFINGVPTAALFIDKAGVSVDRDGGREEKDIVESFKRRFGKKDDYVTMVKLSAGECRSVGTFPIPIGNHKNKYHAEIWNSEKEQLIPLLKAMQLAQLCREVGQQT